MNQQEIIDRRLRNQRLAGPPFATPEDVVGAFGAVQAQEFALAKWSIAQRCRLVTEAAIDRALAGGTILRTHALRPTWHFVLPADIRWILALTGPRVQAMSAFYYRQAGLDHATFARSHKVMAKALDGGRQLTRHEMAAVLEKAKISPAGLRLGHLLMHAELDGVICGGARKGKHHAYALLDERAPQSRSLPRDEALTELTVRYFTGHGPATVKDFTWWSSLTVADIRKGLDMAGVRLQHSTVGDRTYWFAPSARPKKPSSAVHLLQAYDEYGIAYTESRDVLTAAVPVSPGDRPLFIHPVVADGRHVGYWRRVPEPRRIVLEFRFPTPLGTAQKDGLDAAVERYRRFSDLPVHVA